MKKVMIFLVVFMAMCSYVYAADWIYAGRYVLSSKPVVAHNRDIFLINHLQVYSGQPMASLRIYGRNAYMPYDVYYKHDHSTDKTYSSKDSYGVSYYYQAKIIPLNNGNKPMGSGVFGGVIFCDYKLGTRGAMGVDVTSFKVCDLKSNIELFTATGNAGSEILDRSSAARAILRLSGHN